MKKKYVIFVLLGAILVSVGMVVYYPPLYWLRSFIFWWRVDLNERYSNVAVDFHGKVIDQYGQPVTGADVPAKVHVHDGLYAMHVDFVDETTDSLGLFRIHGHRGTEMELSVKKSGYLFAKKLGYLFDLPLAAKDGPASINNPFIIPAWRNDSPPKRQLRTETHKFNLIPDGRNYYVNLLAGTISEQKDEGDLLVSITRPKTLELNVRFDWSIHLELKDGGLTETNDPFLFLAPETGYLPRYDLTMKANAPDWAIETTRQFYLFDRKSRHYTAIEAEISPAQNDDVGRISLRYWINSEGGRNLEHAR